MDKIYTQLYIQILFHPNLILPVGLALGHPIERRLSQKYNAHERLPCLKVGTYRL